jgi:hypothetical protein
MTLNLAPDVGWPKMLSLKFTQGPVELAVADAGSSSQELGQGRHEGVSLRLG